MTKKDTPTGLRPVNKTLPIVLVRAREALLSYWRPTIAEMGLTEQQWRVLRVVAECGPMDISSVADGTALHMPSVTRILHTLDELGYIDRRRDEVDSRRSWIMVTAKTREIMANCVETSDEIYARISEKFDDKKMAELIDLLNEFAEIQIKD